MKKSRFSESQIVSALKAADAGEKVADICRQYGVSQATFYKWRSKYGGMDASMLKSYKELEAKYNRLQKMYSDAKMDNETLKEILEGKL